MRPENALPQRPYHKIGGVDVSYCSRGTGPTILLTHGVPGDLRSLLPVADALADSYKAITVSLPAQSPEHRPQRPFGTDSQAEDIWDLIWSLGGGPIHLVAWSYSAHAALKLAAHYPESIASLFLFEPGFPTYIDDQEIAELVANDTMAAFTPVAEAFDRGELIEAVRAAIDGATGQKGYFDNQPANLRRIHVDNAATIPLLFSQSPPTPLGRQDLGKISCPVTVARGQNTRLCYRFVSDEAACLIPNARRVIVSGGHHLFPEQKPTQFAQLIVEHLSFASAQGEVCHVRG